MSSKARAAIDAARTTAEGVAISGITLFELALLISKGRIDVGAGLGVFLQEMESRFIVLPITASACARANALPKSYPKDPFDRIIGATALDRGLSLVTADRAIRRSKALNVIW